MAEPTSTNTPRALRRRIGRPSPGLFAGGGAERRDDLSLRDLRRLVGGAAVTPAGVSVSRDSALTWSAYYACVNVLASDLAALPLHVFDVVGDSPRRAVETTDYDLLRVSPDGERTAYDWRRACWVHVFTWGNAYSEIEWSASGAPIGLHLLDPARVKPVRRDGKLEYELGNGRSLPAASILHFAGLGYDGLVGYDPIRYNRSMIGLGQAADQYGATFFGNGAQAGGVLETDATLDDEAHKRLRDDWNALHQGSDRAHGVAILEAGLKFKPITVPPETAQFLETRKYQAIEMCRVFRVPPNKIGDMSEAHLANIENANIDYVESTLLPNAVSFESQLNLKLYGRSYASRVRFAEHSLNGRLRGNMSARAAFYKELFAVGALSPNQIARLENTEPAGPAGDERYVPMNMHTLDAARIAAQSSEGDE